MSSVHTNVFLTDDDEVRLVSLKDGSEVIAIDHHRTQVFIGSREQAERLFDVVSEATMRWRERQPDQATVDAVISDPLADLTYEQRRNLEYDPTAPDDGGGEGTFSRAEQRGINAKQEVTK